MVLATVKPKPKPKPKAAKPKPKAVPVPIHQPVYPSTTMGPQNRDLIQRIISYGDPTGSGDPGDGSAPYDPNATPDAPALPKEKQLQPLNWRDYLVNWGFEDDIVNELDRIFRTYSDPQAAGAAALGYIRGTQWYQKTFPGINEGIRRGVVTDEQSYRSYVNDLTQMYQRYYGRNVATTEVLDYLNAGKNQGIVGRELQGVADVNANRNDWQFALGAFGDTGQASDEELKQLGQYHSGLTNMLGPDVQRRLDAAMQRLHGVFQGTLATPAGMRLTSFGRVEAPSLSGGISNTDVAA